MFRLKIGILDDYQEVARTLADWSSLDADVRVFTAPFADADEVRRSLERARTRTLVLSFDTDWRFPTRHSVEIAEMLESAGAPVVRREIASPHGHDSFLLPVPEYHEAVRAFLED